MDLLVTAAHKTSRGEAGRLAVGFYTSLSAGNLRATLVDYVQRFRGIELGMVESSRARLVSALRNGTIDVAIVTGETPFLDNTSMSLWSERILVTLPEGHRLAANETIYWTDLKDETLLLSTRDVGPETQDLLAAKLASPNDRPKIMSHDVSSESIKSLVGAGFGIGLAIESSLSANVAGLTYRELRDGNGPSRVDYSAHWREDNGNPALASFLKLLGERYSSPLV